MMLSRGGNGDGQDVYAAPEEEAETLVGAPTDYDDLEGDPTGTDGAVGCLMALVVSLALWTIAVVAISQAWRWLAG